MRHSTRVCTNTVFVLTVSASLLYLLTCHVRLHAHVFLTKCHIPQNILMEIEYNPCTLTDSSSNPTVLRSLNLTDLLNEEHGQGLKHVFA